MRDLLLSVAVCCSVLQCVAVWCSALQCVAVRNVRLFETCNVHCSAVLVEMCNVLRGQSMCWVFLSHSCCSVLQCVVVCCSVLQCVAVCSSVRLIEMCYQVKALVELFGATLVAVCCIVLQCVTVSWNVLQCVAVCSCARILKMYNVLPDKVCWDLPSHSCCSLLQSISVCCSALQNVAVCCSVLQCAVKCCSVLQCVAVCCSVLQCVAVCWYVQLV